MMMKTAFLMLAVASNVMAGNNGKAKDLPNGKPFQNLQQQIDVLKMNLTDIESMMNERANDLQDQLDTLSAQVEANRNNITSLLAQQEVQDELIATLTGSIAELTERVSQNEDDVEDAFGLLESTLEAAVTAIDVRLDALEDDIEELEESVGTNADGVAANAAAILQADALLQQKVSMLQVAIDAAAGVATTNSASISNLESALADAQAGLATKQDRVSGVCPPGSSIRAIATDGSVSCEADDAFAVLSGYTASRIATRNHYYNSSYRRYYYSYYAVAHCASGYTPTGGGFYKTNAGIEVRYSLPNGNSGWAVYTEYTPYTGSVYAYARCIRAF